MRSLRKLPVEQPIDTISCDSLVSSSREILLLQEWPRPTFRRPQGLHNIGQKTFELGSHKRSLLGVVPDSHVQ